MPLRAGMQDPQNAVENGSSVFPGTTLSTAMLELLRRKMRDDSLPLLVGERHGNGRSRSGSLR